MCLLLPGNNLGELTGFKWVGEDAPGIELALQQDQLRFGLGASFSLSRGLFASAEGVFYLFAPFWEYEDSPIQRIALYNTGVGLDVTLRSERYFRQRSFGLQSSVILSPAMASFDFSVEGESGELRIFTGYLKLDFGLLVIGTGYDSFHVTLGVLNLF